MSACRVDLFLAGELGAWALEQTTGEHVRTVITPDAALAKLAASRGFSVTDHLPAEQPADPAAAALSVHYPKILPAALLAKYRAAYNLHPGFLPWGRGYFPAFWALFDGTPAGATLHHMAPDLDRGPIIEQIPVEYTDADTGGSLHARIRIAEKSLFNRYWPKIRAGETLPATPQQGTGSYHSRADFFQIKHPENWNHLDAQALLKRIRCLTFPGYSGLEIPLEGRRVHLSLQEIA